eukprot:s1882_g3.t2
MSELKECSFQPAPRGARRSGDTSSLSPVSQSALLRRLTAPSSPGARARQRLEAWKAEREAMEGECTFSPNTISSSRSFQVVRAGMTARAPDKVDSARSAKDRSQLEPSFIPATNPVPMRMRSAKAYLQQSVFRRLSQPVTPRRDRTSEVPSFASTRPSPLSRCSSAPTVGDESLLRFLRRQNFCEEVRQNRLGQLEAAVAPPLRPVLCERSLQMSARAARDRYDALMPRDAGDSEEPHQAMKGISQLLLPGECRTVETSCLGFLLLGAPFIDGVHGCPDDFFRYTPHGLRKVAEFAGLEVLMESSPGHQIAAAGEMMGMRSSYWRTEADGCETDGFSGPNRDLLQDSDTHPMNVFLLARKPLRPGHRRPLGPSVTSAESEKKERGEALCALDFCLDVAQRFCGNLAL